MYDLITIGDIKLDTFVRIKKAKVHCRFKEKTCELCFDYGKKIPVDGIESQVAGSAPNVAVALSKIKKKTAVFSIMGEDITHKLALEFFKKHHVNTKFIQKDNKIKSSYAVVVNFKGESTQLVSHHKITYRLPKNFSRSKWIHISEMGEKYHSLFQDLVKRKKQNPKLKISFNPGVIQIKEKKKSFLALLKHTDLLFVNRREANDLAGTQNASIPKLMSQLKQLGPHYIVITDGRDGAYAFDGEEIDFAPMFPGKRIEATGAGDAFTSGFLGAIMHNLPHAEALKWGSVNAASVVFHVGPTTGLLHANEIKTRLKNKPRYKTKKL